MAKSPSPKVTIATSPSVPVTKAADFKVEFANHLRVRLTPADIGVAFGFQDQGPDGKNHAEERVLIIMTPAIAKNLAISLTATIKAFESAWGQINLIPQTLAEAERTAVVGAIQRAAEESIKSDES